MAKDSYIQLNSRLLPCSNYIQLQFHSEFRFYGTIKGLITLLIYAIKGLLRSFPNSRRQLLKGVSVTVILVILGNVRHFTAKSYEITTL